MPTDQEKREVQKLKAIQGRVAEKLPFIKNPLLDVICAKIANSEIKEEDVLALDKKVVSWPQAKGKLDTDYKVAQQELDMLIKEKLKAINKFYSVIWGKVEYKLEDVHGVAVKIFQRFNLKGVKYLGLTMKNGTKFLYILDNEAAIKKAARETSRTTYTSEQVVA